MNASQRTTDYALDRLYATPYRLHDGWHCMVAGRCHGPWPLKGYAQAGYEVELRREVARRAKLK